MNKKFKNLMDKIYNLYDKYMVNRQYKNRSFESEDQYLKLQEQLAEEINEMEKIALIEFRKVFEEVFPHAEVLAYDSRHIRKGKAKFGNLLIKGLKDLEEARTLQKYFESETYFSVLIQRYEDLDEETQKTLKFEGTETDE